MILRRIWNALIYESLFENEESDWYIEKGTLNMSNGELTLYYTSTLHLKAVDLSKYNVYSIDFDVYNYNDNRMQFGTDFFYLEQDVKTTHIFFSRPSYNYDIGYNIFNKTGQWNRISFIKNMNKTIIAVPGLKMEFDVFNKGKNFYVYKWFSGSMKIRNLRISVLKGMSCFIKKKTSLGINSYLLLILLRTDS